MRSATAIQIVSLLLPTYLGTTCFLSPDNLIQKGPAVMMYEGPRMKYEAGALKSGTARLLAFVTFKLRVSAHYVSYGRRDHRA
jgi:hypothetical protein